VLKNEVPNTIKDTRKASTIHSFKSISKKSFNLDFIQPVDDFSVIFKSFIALIQIFDLDVNQKLSPYT
jgi:hypothetical protein